MCNSFHVNKTFLVLLMLLTSIFVIGQSDGYRGRVDSSTPVEQNIWNIAQHIYAEMWNRETAR